MVCGAVASPPANAWWGVLKGGTSIIWRLPGRHAQVQVKLASQWNVVVVGWVPDTLLGPEGSGDTDGSPGRLRCSRVGVLVRGARVSSGRGPCRWRSFAVSGVGCRLYFENFTVDASIFVAKFLRAHGGCLGTRNR